MCLPFVWTCSANKFRFERQIRTAFRALFSNEKPPFLGSQPSGADSARLARFSELHGGSDYYFSTHNPVVWHTRAPSPQTQPPTTPKRPQPFLVPFPWLRLRAALLARPTLRYVPATPLPFTSLLPP